MTIREYAIKYYQDRGMFENQAEECTQKCMSSDLLLFLSSSWNKEIEHFPETIRKVLEINLSSIALDYIDENIPEAWFRGLFETNQTKKRF